jgi:hypothetical protein
MNIFVKKFDSNLNLVQTKQLTDSPIDQDSPSLIKVGSEFFLAYQSWDTGLDNGGDIFITRFDQNWKQISNVQLTAQKSYQDHPSIAFANGAFYVAYASREKGNLDIFVKKFDGNLKSLETKTMTSDKSDQDYPSLSYVNGMFNLLYSSKKTGNNDISLDRYDRNWKAVDSTAVVVALGDQTAPSMAYNSPEKLYWLAYASKDTAGQNILVKSLKLSSPLKDCDIATTFSSTKANSPYTMTMKFYNNYGELADPLELSLSWTPQDAARQSDKPQRMSKGVYQLNSVFGAKGEKAFHIVANIDGCVLPKTVVVKVT